MWLSNLNQENLHRHDRDWAFILLQLCQHFEILGEKRQYKILSEKFSRNDEVAISWNITISTERLDPSYLMDNIIKDHQEKK